MSWERWLGAVGGLFKVVVMCLMAILGIGILNVILPDISAELVAAVIGALLVVIGSVSAEFVRARREKDRLKREYEIEEKRLHYESEQMLRERVFSAYQAAVTELSRYIIANSKGSSISAESERAMHASLAELLLYKPSLDEEYDAFVSNPHVSVAARLRAAVIEEAHKEFFINEDDSGGDSGFGEGLERPSLKVREGKRVIRNKLWKGRR